MKKHLVPLLLLTLLAGCDMLGIESPEKLAATREADGKAVGGACRHAGRAIEDCYALNKKADRAAVFAGWREMNDYMRENKIEALPPQLNTDTVAQVVDTESRKGSRGAERAERASDRLAEKQPEKSADKPRSKDSGSVTTEKTRKGES